jgi:hypothetical protein
LQIYQIVTLKVGHQTNRTGLGRLSGSVGSAVDPDIEGF